MHFMDEPKGNPNVDRRQCLSAANVSLGLMFYGILELVRVADVANVICVKLKKIDKNIIYICVCVCVEVEQ